MGKWAKYQKRYSEAWEREADFKEWIQKVSSDATKAFCKYCRSQIRAHRGDLISHSSTRKHRRNAAPFSSMNQAKIVDNCIEMEMKLAAGPRPGTRPGGVMAVNLELEERLREACSIGDAEAVRRLLESGARVNGQNLVNGWTCLHWACKRGHTSIVSDLLKAGADKEILTAKCESVAQLTSKPEIRAILGVDESTGAAVNRCAELPIVPSYLANLPLPLESGHGSGTSCPAPTACSTPLPNTSQCVCQQAKSPATILWRGAVPEREQVDESTGAAVNGRAELPIGPNYLAYLPLPLVEREKGSGKSCPAPTACSTPLPTTSQWVCLQAEGPATSHLLWRGAVPEREQELVLKVRLHNPVAEDNDFIEVELDRCELTYQALLRVTCQELAVSPEKVERIRKLPNTLLRKDKDVTRLENYQELELVLMKGDGGVKSVQVGLTDRPCYNPVAATLLY